MSSGYVRKDEEENVPLAPPAWMMMVTYSKTGFKEKELHFTKTGMLSLVDELRSAKANQRFYVIWHGQWNTDLFLVNPIKIAERLEVEYKTELMKQRTAEKERIRLNEKWKSKGKI